MFRLISGMVTGGLVSVVGLGALSLAAGTPVQVVQPDVAPLDVPDVDVAAEILLEGPVDSAVEQGDENAQGNATPVGSVTVDAPQAPDVPQGDAAPTTTSPDPISPPAAPQADEEPEARAPSTDTDPLAQPVVASIEGALLAPDATDNVGLIAQDASPVLPNPQSIAPQSPQSDADLSVSTTPAQPFAAEDPVTDIAAGGEDTSPETFIVIDDAASDMVSDDMASNVGADSAVDALNDDAPRSSIAADATTETFVVDRIGQNAAQTQLPDVAPRLQLSGENTLMNDRDTGVTIWRPTDDDAGEDTTDATADGPALDADVVPTGALALYSADPGDIADKPMMSFVLIDDGSMPNAIASLASLPFKVTIALDPARVDARAAMDTYRAAGVEVVVMASLPEGARPSDVEINFESVFTNLPETVGLLDLGAGGLQSDPAVTQQAMEFLANQGRGFVSVRVGLNRAGRMAVDAGVPSVVVTRDLDSEDQDARVVRRFVDQAAFRARQDNDVVLVGRIRVETMQALMQWGSDIDDDQFAVVPVSALMLAQ